MKTEAMVYRRLDSGVCFAQTKRGESIFIPSRIAGIVDAQIGSRVVLVIRENVPEKQHLTPFVAVAVEPEDSVPEPEPEVVEPTPVEEEEDDDQFRLRAETILFLPRNELMVWTGRSLYEELTGESFSYKKYGNDKARLRRLNMCYTILLYLSEQKKIYCCRIGYNERRASYMAFSRTLGVLLPCGEEEDCASDTIPV